MGELHVSGADLEQKADALLGSLPASHLLKRPGCLQIQLEPSKAGTEVGAESSSVPISLLSPQDPLAPCVESHGL